MARRNKRVERRIARERIEILFKLAEEEALKRHFERSKRYVELARKIGMRYNTSLPSYLKRRFCHKCGSFLLPSVNCRVRLSKKKITIKCEDCGHRMRFPYIRKDASKQ